MGWLIVLEIWGSCPMPARGREVRFNRAPYLQYYQPSHFVFIGFCCKKVKLSFDISLKKIKSARMIEKVKLTLIQ